MTRTHRHWYQGAALAAALTAGALPAHALPAPAAVGTSTAGVAATGGLIGVATFLGIYDLIRRATCSGDPLRLGGPGFTSPVGPSDNVLVPRCRPAR